MQNLFVVIGYDGNITIPANALYIVTGNDIGLYTHPDGYIPFAFKYISFPSDVSVCTINLYQTGSGEIIRLKNPYSFAVSGNAQVNIVYYKVY